jgi:alpha-tubulin suppressor-like RCC1 family protein
MRSPGQVELDENIVQVSAGDSHSAALTENGVVYIWGNFRVSKEKYIYIMYKSSFFDQYKILI